MPSSPSSISLNDVNIETQKGSQTLVSLNDDIFRRLSGISTTSGTQSSLSDAYGDSNPILNSYTITADPGYYDVPQTLTVYLNKAAIQNTDVSATVVTGTPYNQTSVISLFTIAAGNTSGSYNFTPSAAQWAAQNTFTITSTKVSGSIQFVLDLSPTPSYSLSGSSGFNENASSTYTVTTTNVPNGTTLYWTVDSVSVSGSPIAASGDLAFYSGSVYINNNSGSFTIYGYYGYYAGSDGTESTEYFNIRLRTDSISGTIVASLTNIALYNVNPPPPPTPPPPPPPPPPKQGGALACSALNTMYGFDKYNIDLWDRWNELSKITLIEQQAYHKLFYPLVKRMHKNKLAKYICEYFAYTRTKAIEQRLNDNNPSIKYWIGRAIFLPPLKFLQLLLKYKLIKPIAKKDIAEVLRLLRKNK